MATDEAGTIHFTQEWRDVLVIDPQAVAARKRARVLAVEARGPFTVETDRGVMAGVAGDMLVTNHPDDDPGSDLWTISRERFDATYTLDEPGGAEALLHEAVRQLRARKTVQPSRELSLAITAGEEALLWLGVPVAEL